MTVVGGNVQGGWPNAWNGGFAAGRYYLGWGGNNAQTLAVTADTLYFTPFVLTKSQAWDRISMEVTSAAGTLGRVGIYRWENGKPTSRLLDAGTFSTAGTGMIDVTIAQTLAPGAYGMASVFDNTPTVRAGVGAGSVLLTLMGVEGAGTTQYQGWTGSHTFAALPATAPTLTALGSAIPTVWLRAA